MMKFRSQSPLVVVGGCWRCGLPSCLWLMVVSKLWEEESRNAEEVTSVTVTSIFLFLLFLKQYTNSSVGPAEYSNV